MTDVQNRTSMFSSPLTAYSVQRTRIDRIFDRATQCKLVYVIANAGYGKTWAVKNYVEQQQDAIVRWVQLSESDNIGSRYWESFTHSIAADNPDVAARLRELGFPETQARFRQFAEIYKNAERRKRRIFLVLDDFNLIHSAQALTFTERCAHLYIPGACVIIISRTEPGINAVSLFSKGNAAIVTEDEMRFTEEEIADFFKQRNIPFTAKNLPQFFDATKGWPLAIKLLSLVLARIPNNLDLALEHMKENIFRILETEAFSDFPEDTQKSVIKLSLISDLPLTPLREVIGNTQLTQYYPQIASFVWYDNFIGDYRVHPLYLEFAQSKQHLLSEDEILDTYRRAAEWCLDNEFYTDAVKYYAKSRQFKEMMMLLLSYPFKMPYDACEFFLGIIEQIDADNDLKDDPDIIFLKGFFVPMLLMGMDRYEEATEHTYDTISRWEHTDTAFATHMLSAAYSNLTYIDTYTCTVTHVYKAAEYLKKSLEYRKLSSIPQADVAGAFVMADVRSFVCLVGEGAGLPDFDRFLANARKTAAYIEETPHKMYYGYDELVACEISYFKNRLDSARNHAHNAVLKASEKNQYSIELMAQNYLLRLALHEGDYTQVKEALRHMQKNMDNPVFWNRALLYDLFTGFFYAQIGLPELMAPWLVMDDNEAISDVRIPSGELIVEAKHYIASKNFKQALTMLCNSYPRDPQERFIFGELTLTLLLAVTWLNAGETERAVGEFKKAYELSFGGVFVMPFIELGRMFRPLATAVLEHGDCGVTEKWLESTERKASIYAKKAAVIANAFKADNKIKEDVSLSDREIEVLSDMYHGLSREEIAENRYLSINTVKKTLQSIYTKLDAGTNVDAIRIGIERKLIK